MSFFGKVDALLTTAIERIITVLFILILIMVFCTAILRYFFHFAIYGMDEIVGIFFIYCSTLGTALAVRRREHIKISLVLEKMPIPLLKVIICISYLMIAIFNASIIYLSVSWLKQTMFIKSNVTGFPFWMSGISLGISSIIVSLYCIYNMVLVFVNNAELQEELGGDLELKEALESITVTGREANSL